MPKKIMYLNKLKNIPGPRLVISMAGGGSKGWDTGTRASYQNPLWSALQPTIPRSLCSQAVAMKGKEPFDRCGPPISALPLPPPIPVCLSVHPSISLSILPNVCSSVCLYVYLLICLLVGLSTNIAAKKLWLPPDCDLPYCHGNPTSPSSSPALPLSHF